MQNIYLETDTRRINAVYHSGSFVQLPPDWRWEKVRTNADRLYLLTAGHFYFNIEGHEFTGAPGDMVFMPRNTLQTYHAYGQPAAKHWFHGMYDLGNTPLYSVLRFPYIVHATDISYVQSLFVKVNAPVNRVSSILHRKSAMLDLLAFFLDATGQYADERFKDEGITDILSFIDTHISDVLTVEALARRMGYSTSYFTRRFRQCTSVSPKEYILRRRIDRSKELLASHDRSVNEIAEDCGFGNNANYFSRVFKERVGVSPLRFRKAGDGSDGGNHEETINNDPHSGFGKAGTP